jgi:RNA polymerase sigma-70 factor (ECF subfamily)
MIRKRTGNKSVVFDSEFFTKMYLEHYTCFVAYLNQFTRNVTEAEDLAQTSFINIWDKRKQLNIKGSFRSYLFSVGYNLFIDSVRKQKKQDLLIEQLKKESLDELIPGSTEEMAVRLSVLEKAISELPAKCRQIFVLHKKEGLSYKRIAEVLGVSLKTVESQMRIAMIKIRKSFDLK